MVAVLLVFANHLFGWPRGGFIGVDVFFVISGFLITGNLLRMAESRGNVSFKRFYWNRVRRIVPAATVVLVLTYLAAILVFQPFRVQQVGLDAVFAFIFMSNWWFASRDTNYFTSSEATSPLQHYWSLSIEEQFYFVWPALIFAIGVYVASKAWTHTHRMRLAGHVMTAVIAVSLAWAFYQTAVSPAWAYFDTFSRIWELGIGALLATAVGVIGRLPANVKPVLSWGGLAVIAASAVLIAEGTPWFPAPLALLPVLGSALVIAAGVAGEPEGQALLQNPISVYIGNISYSLYLVHWPVIVILGSYLTIRGTDLLYYIAVIAISFGLAITSYHFIENPLRYGSREKLRRFGRQTRKMIQPGRRPEFPQVLQSTKRAALGALAAVTIGAMALVMSPGFNYQAVPSVKAGKSDPNPGNGGNPAESAIQPENSAPPSDLQRKSGPLGAELQTEIAKALTATEWPSLEPSLESVLSSPLIAPEFEQCNNDPNPDACTWGSQSAPVRVMLTGDSIALTYAESLRKVAEESGGQIQLRLDAMAGCRFLNDPIENPDKEKQAACMARREKVITEINETKPDVVIMANSADPPHHGGPLEWADRRRQVIDKFRNSTKKLVFVSPPPLDKNIRECYGVASSVPTACIGEITDRWSVSAKTEQSVAESFNGIWIDSSPWFCSSAEGLCPAFVGSTLTKWDWAHPTRTYAEKIGPVVGESLRAAGVF